MLKFSDDTIHVDILIVTVLYLKLTAISRFCVEGLPKMLDFGHFVLIWWQTDEKQEILKQSCKDMFT